MVSRPDLVGFSPTQSPWPSLRSSAMAKTYRLGPARRLINALVKGLLRVGLAGRHTYVLSVSGRRSGRTSTEKVWNTPKKPKKSRGSHREAEQAHQELQQQGPRRKGRWASDRIRSNIRTAVWESQPAPEGSPSGEREHQDARDVLPHSRGGRSSRLPQQLELPRWQENQVGALACGAGSRAHAVQGVRQTQPVGSG
jgi:hypothetical protein